MHPLDHELIGQRYFFPRKDRLPNPTIVESEGHTFECLHHQNQNPKTVLFFHGNGEVAADYGEAYGDFVSTLGADLFIAEYRGYGGSSGKPQLASMLKDIDAFIKAIDRPLNEIIVFGRSVGSIYAVHAVSRFPKLGGLILESGIHSVEERIRLRVSAAEVGLNETDFKIAFEDFDHVDKLMSYHGRALILHAEHDDLVHKAHAIANAEALALARDVELKIFDRGDHNSIFFENREAYAEALGKFLTSP